MTIKSVLVNDLEGQESGLGIDRHVLNDKKKAASLSSISYCISAGTWEEEDRTV
jgi:hypothetical protein